MSQRSCILADTARWYSSPGFHETSPPEDCLEIGALTWSSGRLLHPHPSFTKVKLGTSEREEPSTLQGRLGVCKASADSLLPSPGALCLRGCTETKPVPNLNPFAESHMELPHLFHSCKASSCCTSFWNHSSPIRLTECSPVSGHGEESRSVQGDECVH